MDNEVYRRNKINLVLAGITLLLLRTDLLGQITGADLQNILLEKDHIYRTNGYTTSFTMIGDVALLDPNQGKVFKDCTVTRTSDTVAMKVNYLCEHEAVFEPVRIGRHKNIPYDKNVSPIAWKPLEKYSICGLDRNETIVIHGVYRVRADGKTMDFAGKSIFLSRFAIGRPSIVINEFDMYELAVGRGYSNYIDSIRTLETLPTGSVRVTCEGSWYNYKGTWELSADPNSDYLVREATFTRDYAEKAAIVISNDGIEVKDAIKVAKNGTIKLAGLWEVIVQTNSIAQAATPNSLFDEVLARFNAPLPKGSQIFDWRSGEVVTSRVK